MRDVSNGTTDAGIELAGRPGETHLQRVTVRGLPEGRLRRVTAYIESNLRRELRLAELGAATHMSPYHFARLFKTATGVSPHRFVVHRRIDAAIALLTTSTSSISSIAQAVGFRTASHFATTFRRMTGVTPTVYRAGGAVGPDGISRAATSQRHDAQRNPSVGG